MKKFVVNILCGTGITLIVLAIIGSLFGAKYLLIHSVFQCFGANIVIHSGLVFTHKVESKYAALDFMLDIGYTIVVLMVFGVICNWFVSTPAWVLIIMAVLIYFAGVSLNMFRMRQDVKKINALLKKRNAQNETAKG